jgi:hypothetical protein
MSTRWLNFEKERQKTSTKLNLLRMKDDGIKNILRENFGKLFNEESEKIMIELDDSFDDTNM